MNHIDEEREECLLSVEIKFPGTFKRIRTVVKIGRETFNQSFASLPRDREIPWEFKAAERARHMIQMRRHLARDIGQRIAEELIEIVQSQDPINGFNREEWASMQEAFARDPCELPKP